MLPTVRFRGRILRGGLFFSGDGQWSRKGCCWGRSLREVHHGQFAIVVSSKNDLGGAGNKEGLEESWVVAQAALGTRTSGLMLPVA